MNAMEILVIILSVFLAIFLIAGIILTLLLIKVTLQIRRVTIKAEEAANSMDSLMKNMTSVASKAVAGRFIMKGLKTVMKKSRGGKR